MEDVSKPSISFISVSRCILLSAIITILSLHHTIYFKAKMGKSFSHVNLAFLHLPFHHKINLLIVKSIKSLHLTFLRVGFYIVDKNCWINECEEAAAGSEEVKITNNYKVKATT